jgi:hypothetical protein
VGDLVGSNGRLLQHGVVASNDSSPLGGSSSVTGVGGWGVADVSPDLAVLLRERYNAEALYPYDLAYSGGTPLPEVECVVTVRLEA